MYQLLHKKESLLGLNGFCQNCKIFLLLTFNLKKITSFICSEKK